MTQTNAELLYSQSEQPNICLEDFQIRNTIDKGAYGKVFLVQLTKAQPSELYAMKVINKDQILDSPTETLQIDTNRLRNIDHHSICKIEYVFQNAECVYFLSKFVKGGHLFAHLRQNKLPESQVKFYVVQIAEVLSYLHSKGIVMKDLRPENILVGEDGKS